MKVIFLRNSVFILLAAAAFFGGSSAHASIVYLNADFIGADGTVVLSSNAPASYAGFSTVLLTNTSSVESNGNSGNILRPIVDSQASFGVYGITVNFNQPETMFVFDYAFIYSTLTSITLSNGDTLGSQSTPGSGGAFGASDTTPFTSATVRFTGTSGFGPSDLASLSALRYGPNGAASGTPEPGTAVLAAAALATVGFFAQRRKKSA